MEYVKGLSMIRDAYGMLYEHCQNMMSRSEWNLAGRTAYDAMEKVALAIDALAGIRTPKQGHHGVRILESALQLLPLVAWRVGDDPSSSVSLFLEKRTSPNHHVRLFKCVHGTLTLLCANSVPSLLDVQFSKDGSTLSVLSGGQPVSKITDTTDGIRLDGMWVQVCISSAKLAILNKYLEPIPVERNTSAYYGRTYCRQDSERICSDGQNLFVPVTHRIGHNMNA
jgi:hypothetical protein